MASFTARVSTLQPNGKKRKDRELVPQNDATTSEGEGEWNGFGSEAGAIEMPSDDEDHVDGINGKVEGLVIGGSEDEDDGSVDEFPEIDARSETEEEEEESDEVESSDAEDGESSTGESSVNGEGTPKVQDERTPGLYPKPKIITSDITGEPKKTYPEIEPEYDSDSSTEDVCQLSCRPVLRVER